MTLDYAICPYAHDVKDAELHAGSSGVFAGVEDEFIAILDASGTQVRVHATKESKGSAPPVMRALEVFPPGAYTLHPGPSWGSLPR